MSSLILGTLAFVAPTAEARSSTAFSAEPETYVQIGRIAVGLESSNSHCHVDPDNPGWWASVIVNQPYDLFCEWPNEDSRRKPCPSWRP